MSNDLFNFNYHEDLEPTDNNYPISDVQWIYINDINANNYANGYINFTNVSIIGSSVDKQYLWSQAYLAIPYTITVLASAGLAISPDPANVNALSVKSYASFIDWVSVKFNGVSCTRNSYYNHLMMNERIKQYNSDKYRLYGDIMCHEWDVGTGISYRAETGERNNNTAPTTLITGSSPSNIVNKGHLDRCAKTNIDITNVLNSSLASFMGTQTSLRDTENQNCLVYQGTTGLVFQGVAIIPLSELHDFFKKMPSVGSSSGFELRLQSNLSRENSYTTRYDQIPANNTAPQVPNLVTSQQIVGHACSILLSNLSGDGSTGFKINTATATAVNQTITVKSCIGWSNTTGQLATQFPGSIGNPCRIYLPSVSYNNDYIKRVLYQPLQLLVHLVG